MCKDPKTEVTEGIWDYMNNVYNKEDSLGTNDQSGEFENSLNAVDGSLVHPLSPQDYSGNLNGELKQENQKIYGAYLDENDYNNIRDLTRHFVSRSLIPYIESQIQSLNESVFSFIIVSIL